MLRRQVALGPRGFAWDEQRAVEQRGFGAARGWGVGRQVGVQALFFGGQYRVVQILLGFCSSLFGLVARDGQAQRQPPGAVCRVPRGTAGPFPGFFPRTLQPLPPRVRLPRPLRYRLNLCLDG